MKTTELFLNDGSTIHLQDDGCWFYFAEDGPDRMKPVVPCDESNDFYSQCGWRYRDAMQLIAKHKEVQARGGE